MSGGLVKPVVLKKAFLSLGVCLFMALFWACSFNVEATNPFPPENPGASTPDTVKTPSPVLTPDTSTLDTLFPPGIQIDPIIVPPETTYVMDTIVIRDTLVIYKDTVYDTLYDTTSYNSFVYRKYINGTLDTVTGWSKGLDCDIGDTAFSCTEKPNYAGILPMCGLSLVATKCCMVEYELLDTNIAYKFVTDTLYKDTFRIQQKVCVNDTTFINYGETRVLDYIPLETIYDASANAFDSTEMRLLLDTLDFTGGEESEIEIKTRSSLEFNGLPLLVRELMPLDSFTIAIGDELRWKHWPNTIQVDENTYYLANRDLESDTTVTWALKYTHYETGRSETDSILVTSFIKVK